MRPAIYLKRGTTRGLVSAWPTMFGVTASGEGAGLALCGMDVVPVEDTLTDAVKEHATAGEESADHVVGRILELMKPEAKRLLDKAWEEVKDGEIALIWPNGKIKCVVDESANEDSVEIDGVDLMGEGVFAYGKKELAIVMGVKDTGDTCDYEEAVSELAQNIAEWL